MTTHVNAHGDTVTTNVSGWPQTLGAVNSPREYAQHTRHAKSARNRHSRQATAFLAHYATSLTTTAANLFASLKKNTAQRVKTTDTYGHLS